MLIRSLHQAAGLGTAFGHGLLDLVLPPRCLACGIEVDVAGGMCPPCWSGLRLIGPPWCRILRLSSAARLWPRLPCAAAAREAPPDYDRARAALRYDAHSARLVLAFKRGGRLEGVPQFARWMAAAGAEILADADLILPVPLHRWRLLRRGFNQSALLAQRIARLTGRPWAPHLLRRRLATASQQGLGAAERRENITAAAFQIARPERVAGARVRAVDDVLTTGATSPHVLPSCAAPVPCASMRWRWREW